MKTKLYKQYLVIGIIILLFGTTFSIGNAQGNSENIEMQQSQTNIISKNDIISDFHDDFILNQESKGTEYWALIFAVGVYLNAPAQDRPTMLQAADDLYDVLVESYQWQGDHIHKVKGGYCYLSRLLEELNWLAQNSDDDDMVIVYLTTHGNSLKDNGVPVDLPPKDEADGMDEILAMYDGFDNKYGYIWDDLLNFFLSRIKSRGLCLIVDSCHSGGFNDVSTEVTYFNSNPASQEAIQKEDIFNNQNALKSSEKTTIGALNSRFISKNTNFQFNPTAVDLKSDAKINKDADNAANLFAQEFIKDVRGQNRIILMSCEEDRLSYGSDFSEYLISGFWGWADYFGNGDGINSAEEAFNYADWWVNLLGRQNPTYLDLYPGEFPVTNH